MEILGRVLYRLCTFIFHQFLVNNSDTRCFLRLILLLSFFLLCSSYKLWGW